MGAYVEAQNGLMVFRIKTMIVLLRWDLLFENKVNFCSLLGLEGSLSVYETEGIMREITTKIP